MAEVIYMPKLSDTMTDGVVAEWHKKVGDTVENGDLLAEIETDKATMEFESFQEGVLLHIGVEAGATAPVDSVLAILGEKGEDVSKLLKEEAEKAASAPKEKEESPAPAAITTPVPAAVVSSTPTTSAPVKPAPVAVAAPIDSNIKVIASPLARKLAEERNLPLARIPGSGDGGRIVKRDIENFIPGGVVDTSESFEEVGVSQMRKIIASRLSESLFTAPHFYLTMDIDMDNAIAARKSVIDYGGQKISFNDMVVKATAKALKRHPKVNSSWLGDRIRYNNHVHVGVAIAIEDGLVVPSVHFADQKTMQDISVEIKDLAVRAKSKKLAPDEMVGSTFTISNLGMFGLTEFTAIINTPNACILAVGGIQQVPVVKKGQVVPGNVMKVTLSCDHRVVDGAMGAEFLQTFKQILENPILLNE
ncbi:MAG: pyruvate dehydrogenase E2 component (dihydrolipoamide acetyltransferase) [Glaciecola sp.]|jgi:pyruvate dehydrogenase E2 component (dihydrolipoamide acetyltransferase)